MNMCIYIYIYDHAMSLALSWCPEYTKMAIAEAVIVGMMPLNMKKTMLA